MFFFRPCYKITTIVSFLDIASAINLISEMNFNILKKEFLILEQSIKEYGQIKSTWLEEHFFNSGPIDEKNSDNKIIFLKNAKQQPKGHPQFLRTQTSTRIGVQKGSTLMKALSDKTLARSLRGADSFDAPKRQRRGDIVSILKMNEESLTITDIKTKAQGLSVKAESIISCSEKTLQRELASMVTESIILKTGEKRWSKYSIPKPLPSV